MKEKKKQDAVVVWLQFVCKLIYWCGLGDYWYEPNKRSTVRLMAYNIFSFANRSYYCAVVCCEISTIFKTKILPAERTDALQFTIAHTCILIKWIIMLIHRERIKKSLKMMMVTTRRLYVNEQIEREQLRKCHVYCLALSFTMSLAITSALVDSVVRYFRTDMPWRTLVTFYSDYDDVSWTAYMFRAFTTFFWYHIVISMLATDFLAVTSLIYVAFKFKSLQSYFLILGTRFEQNLMGKSQEKLEDDMRREFLKGVKLHKDTLWCAHSIQNALGNVYSCQLTQSVGLLVNCLIKLVTNERNLTFLFATSMFILCMLVLTAAYMWSAGELTYEVSEASLVGDAMFQSGWHLCSARARMRKLLVVGIIRSQVPVVMTAFGVVDLSYVNFIKILKNSYSVFAVLY